MGKVKEQLGELPFGTEADGVVSVTAEYLEHLESELSGYEIAISLLRHRIKQIILDNFLEEEYDISEMMCVSDKSLTEFTKITKETQ